MNRKIYVPPDAKLTLFAPDHPLANSTTADTSAWWSFWKWGGGSNVTGNVNVWQDKGNPPDWIYNGSGDKKPY